MKVWRRNTLAFRLSWTLVLATTGLFSALALVQVKLQEQLGTHTSTINALTLTEGVFGVLHRSMLVNDRQGLHDEVRSIAQRSSNLRVRIFNKEGEVVFSSIAAETGQRVNPQSEACYKCHAAGRPIERLAPGDRTREFSVDGVPAVGVIKPIENEASCSEAACHAHGPNKRLLGVLDVTLMMPDVIAAREMTTLLTVVTAALATLLTAIIVSSVIRGAVHAPVRRILETLDRLRGGDLSVRHPHENIAEFARLASAVNDTAVDLQRANAELVDWAQTLERRVAAKTQELERAQRQMIHVERMASLGKLAAVVAHEINNPLASVLTYSKLLLKRVNNKGQASFDLDETRQILEGIASESARCGDIVSNLLMFARRSGTRMEPTDVNAVVRRVLFLLKHKMDLASVTATTTLGDDIGAVLCDPGQIEQALIALCVNAVEAMPGGGEISVATLKEDTEGVSIAVRDTGPGIAEHVIPHIFEPFFSTKEQSESKGLGLGLSVVYGIVQHHGGRTDVQSKLGSGTTFSLHLPGTIAAGRES